MKPDDALDLLDLDDSGNEARALVKFCDPCQAEIDGMIHE